MGTWKKWTFGEKGTPSALKKYLKCPGPITPKCSQMGTKANGDLGQMDLWWKGVPKVPYRGIPSAFGPLPQNVHKWAPRQMELWGKEVPQVSYRGTPSVLQGYPKCLMPFSPKCLQMGFGVNVHLGKRCTPSALHRYPKCPMPISPKCLQMGSGVNGDFGQMNIWGKGVTQVP